MIRNPGGFGALNQPFQFLEVLAIELLCRAEIHGDAMLDDPILLQDLVQHSQWPAAVAHEILGDDLKPIYYWLTLKNVSVVRDTEPDADPVISVSVETVGRHKIKVNWSKRDWRLLRLRSTRSGQADLQPPWPLQSFCPLQAWVAVLQPPCPLQAFFPAQSCLAVELVDSMPAFELAQPAVPRVAPAISPANAAVANLDPVAFFLLFISILLFFVCVSVESLFWRFD